MNYLISASLVLLLAWPAIHLLLRYSNRYALNRGVLLVIIAIMAMFPLLPLESPAPEATHAVHSSIDYVVTDFELTSEVTSETPTNVQREAAAAAGGETTTSVPNTAYVSWSTVYLAGFGVFLLILVIRLLALLTSHLRSRPNGDYAYRLLHPDARAGQAYSFGRAIYFSIDVPDAPDFDHILAHEQIHAEQGHSLDIMLSELFLCAFWFHPVAWWMRSKLRANLEYLVDAEVINGGVSRRDYQLALVRQSQVANGMALALPFSEPTLHGRIARMTGIPQHRVVAFMATIALLFWVAVAGVVIYGEVRPVYTGEEPFVAYYKDKVPAEISSFNLYAMRAPTVDEYYQLRAILKHIPETELYLYKNRYDDGITMRLDHWQNQPVTVTNLLTTKSERRIRLGLMQRMAPFQKNTVPLPTGGYYVPVSEDNAPGRFTNPRPGSNLILQSYGHEPSKLDLQYQEFENGEELIVMINGKRFPLRAEELVPADNGEGYSYLFDNGSVAPTQWKEAEYYPPYQNVASKRFTRILGCSLREDCPRTISSIYNPSPEQAQAWFDKYNPGEHYPVRAYYNDRSIPVDLLLSRNYGPNSMLTVGYRTDDVTSYVVQVIDDSPAQISRVTREINQPSK